VRAAAAHAAHPGVVAADGGQLLQGVADGGVGAHSGAGRGVARLVEGAALRRVGSGVRGCVGCVCMQTFELPMRLLRDTISSRRPLPSAAHRHKVHRAAERVEVRHHRGVLL
jgi:hypothetical protein